MSSETGRACRWKSSGAASFSLSAKARAAIRPGGFQERRPTSIPRDRGPAAKGYRRRRAGARLPGDRLSPEARSLRPGSTLMRGNGQIPEIASDRTRKPTARLVASTGMCHRDRLIRSTTLRRERARVAQSVKRCVANERLVRKRGRLGRSRPSIISTSGKAMAMLATMPSPGTRMAMARMRRRPKALLQMAEKPVEIDGVFWRLVIEEPPNSAARQDIPARRRAGHRVPWRPRPRHSPCCRLP